MLVKSSLSLLIPELNPHPGSKQQLHPHLKCLQAYPDARCWTADGQCWAQARCPACPQEPTNEHTMWQRTSEHEQSFHSCCSFQQQKHNKVPSHPGPDPHRWRTSRAVKGRSGGMSWETDKYSAAALGSYMHNESLHYLVTVGHVGDHVGHVVLRRPYQCGAKHQG